MCPFCKQNRSLDHSQPNSSQDAQLSEENQITIPEMLYLFILYQMFLLTTFVSAAGPFTTSLLQTHNRFRARHGAAPLTWSPAIAANALKVSKTCVFAHSKTPNSWGENIASGFATPGKAIEAMYNSEKGMYPYGEPKWNVGFPLATTPECS
jgi:uncharacterized protein YkwD